jgi:hypothetical protein
LRKRKNPRAVRLSRSGDDDQGYREKIESELAKICEDILDVLDKHLIPSIATGKSKVFYRKM